MSDGYYGWVAERSRKRSSPAEEYGWDAHFRRVQPYRGASARTEHCVECGAEFTVYPTGALYECDKCMNRLK